MVLLFIKIVLLVFALRHIIGLLKQVLRLSKKYPLIKFLWAALFIGIFIFHRNIFTVQVFKLSPHQIISIPASWLLSLQLFSIIKLTVFILLVKWLIAFMVWLLKTSKKNKTTNPLGDDFRGAGFGVRAANTGVVVNGIFSFKTLKNNFVYTLMLLLISGNWISHHIMLCGWLLFAFYSFKSCSIILNFLKTLAF